MTLLCDLIGAAMQPGGAGIGIGRFLQKSLKLLSILRDDIR